MRLIPASGRLLLPLLAATRLVSAGPFPRDNLHDNGYSYLMMRGCDSYCGSDNQYCCESGQTCTTLDNDVATCMGGGGGYGAYTTTWTETHTYTSTIITNWAPVPSPTAGVDCIPQNSQQQACGDICCAGWQTCAFSGQCSAKPGYSAPTTVVVTSNGVVTTQYSAPFRVTGVTTIVTSGVHTGPASTGATATSTATTTSATGTSAGDSLGGKSSGTGGGGLSGGAIAGIVIGTLVGVALLILLAFCCIVRGLWHVIFGRKKDKKHERVDVYEERYSRHGSRPPSNYGGRNRHSGWFGGRPASAGDRQEKKKSHNGRWLLGAGAAAATLLALLNMRKDKKPPRKQSGRSRYSDSYYSYSYGDGSSPSSASSDRRTHRTRRTQRSDGSGSRYTRNSRRK